MGEYGRTWATMWENEDGGGEDGSEVDRGVKTNTKNTHTLTGRSALIFHMNTVLFRACVCPALVTPKKNATM